MIVDKAVVIGLLAILVAVVTLVACGQRKFPASSTAIASVGQAPDQASARRLAFTGRAHTAVIGVHGWSIKHVRSVGKQDVADHEMWVIPVVDVEGSLGDEVKLWVTPSFQIDGGTDPSAFFEQLRAEFDGKPQDLVVRGRATDNPDAGWVKAVATAEATFGVTSHPDAPVVSFPPK